ncbi:MAG TPA: EcsC family protein [Pirellulales bacterium]|nr:EcsC family protein [Pirellulales bacterium]
MERSKYDEHALAEIHAWKNPELGWFGQAMTWLNWLPDKVGDLLLATPGVGDAIRFAIEGITSVCNDLAQWTVSTAAIYNEFRKAGHADIRDADDIQKLDLEQIDKIVGWLDAKYKGIALVEGAGLGSVGLPGIPPDVVALITLNLRAVGEYATYYGFDISQQQERLFALNILGLASSSTAKCKGLAMAQLVKIAEDVAKKRAWKTLEQHTFVQVIQQISKALGIRLTKEKLAQVIPVAGAVVGGGFNAYFTSNVCQAAYYLYRERFLAEKYGPEVVEETVPPAEDIDPHYPEEDEIIPLLGSPLPNRVTFESAYAGQAPWDIGKPQKSLIEVADQITGSILDAGCGTGENALFFASRGNKVTGIDFLAEPINRAKQKATERGLSANFLVMGALALKDFPEVFDTVIDSGLFHVFSDDDRRRYAEGLVSVLKPGGRLFLLCFSDQEPGVQGPRRVSRKEIEDTFANGWAIERVTPSRFEARFDLKDITFSEGGPKAWFVVARRDR